MAHKTFKPLNRAVTLYSEEIYSPNENCPAFALCEIDGLIFLYELRNSRQKNWATNLAVGSFLMIKLLKRCCAPKLVF